MNTIRPPDKLRISSGGQNLPSKGILLGVPGIGKTGVASQAPSPIVLMTRRENGLETLIDNGIVAPTPHFPEVNDWLTLLQALDLLLINGHAHKTFVLDTLNGAQRLCFEHVVATEFENSWEKFNAYARGPERALPEWNKLFSLLHKLNTQKRMLVLLLAHCRIKTFKNPQGDDYDRYQAELEDKTWAVAEQWADLILFANFETHAKKDKGALRAKATGGEARFFYTQRTAAYDAKNRFNLEDEIPMGDSPQKAWSNLVRAIATAKAKHAPPAEQIASTNGQEPVTQAQEN